MPTLHLSKPQAYSRLLAQQTLQSLYSPIPLPIPVPAPLPSALKLRTSTASTPDPTNAYLAAIGGVDAQCITR